MGTSTSSAGASAGVSFDPPWLNDVERGLDTTHGGNLLAPDDALVNGSNGDDSNEQENNQVTHLLTPRETVTPSGRYKEARRALTGFVQSGNSSDLRRGVSSFVKKGMGGPVRAAARMRTSAVAASSLGGFLATARDGTDPSINAWVVSVRQRGLSAQDTALEVVLRLVPTGGSIDEESAKHAMNQAIAYLYEVEPNADIFSLTDEQIAIVMTNTVAFDVYNRVQLELGRVFERLKYAPQVIQERFAQALDYIMVIVRRSMKKVRSSGMQRSMREIAAATLQDALTVFAKP